MADSGAISLWYRPGGNSKSSSAEIGPKIFGLQLPSPQICWLNDLQGYEINLTYGGVRSMCLLGVSTFDLFLLAYLSQNSRD